ncbi:unnamed protein product [Mytilus coruscus]|uniref:Uncharacterized protein n=1 Tax=Mytilus coruscus TaxID=42192 RepID=A0A6J8BV78_MYTCO|nr:unnamed protein product [Mytilus coruscus]
MMVRDKPMGYIFLDGNTQFWLRRSDTIVVHLNKGDDVWVKSFDVTYSCLDVYVAYDHPSNATYWLQNDKQDDFQAYCPFGGENCYTFIANRASFSGINMSRLNPNRSFALLRHLNPDGTQWETRLEQLSGYKKQSLGYFYDSYPDYNQPKRVGTNCHFIYLGLLPISLARYNNTQGYRANGKDFTFHNCDRTPNSYFAFYFNLHSDPYPGWMPNDFTTDWKDTSVKLKHIHYMPDYFYFQFLIHMGGCGGLDSPQSYNGSLAAVGIPFNIPISATIQQVRPSTKQPTNPVITSQLSVFTTIPFVTSNQVHNSRSFVFPTIKPITSNHVTASLSSVFSTKQLVTSNHVTTSRWNSSKGCICSCNNDIQRISHFRGKHRTKEQIKQELQKLRDIIKISKNSTSAAIRSLISINSDERITSTGMGVSAIILIVLPFTLMIATDCSNMYRK